MTANRLELQPRRPDSRDGAQKVTPGMEIQFTASAQPVTYGWESPLPASGSGACSAAQVAQITTRNWSSRIRATLARRTCPWPCRKDAKDGLRIIGRVGLGGSSSI